MADPVPPASVPPHDEEQVSVLDLALRSGARTVSEEVIPLVEETATVGKRQVVTGRACGVDTPSKGGTEDEMDENDPFSREAAVKGSRSSACAA